MRSETVSVAEAAAITGVSADTVKRRIKRGDLPAVRIGKAYRIDRADLGADADMQDLIGKALAGVGAQIQQLAARIEQREQSMASLEKAVTALVTKVAGQ